MNRTANTIKNRLSLRPPQADSLNILSELSEKFTLKKNAPLEEALQIVRSSYPICTDFERNFPSLCFALATGVGKTRLMGSFVAYLFIEKKIKNFFVLAPNLTIYNKLIDDFSNTSSPKYVFRGIGEFVHNQPRIITGDNYDSVSQHELFKSQIHINVFNISKINSETRGGKAPRIKRLSEYLGESYFNYLASLEDLVLLMDESHHYRATRGLEVINELKPILGLEVTATPQIEKAGGATKFKNVVYEYSLSKAIKDGFVKEPAVATRRNFDPSKYTLEDLDRIKLEDGIRIHEDTKVALDIYSRDTKTKPVKPFVLVVAKDTTHAKKLKELIQSQSFFNGYYSDKVMEIHSKQAGTERDENIEQLMNLEKPDNKIEIVIHVNMLKEGWDVTNLYTIIPLRTAASQTLREQTIGRGLRLPFGKRTGVDKVDKLTIVAHDKFQEIVDAANLLDSIIKLENIITIDEEEISHTKEVVTSQNTIESSFEEEQKRINEIQVPEDKVKAQNELVIKKHIYSVLPEMGKLVKNINELNHEEIKKAAIENIKNILESKIERELFEFLTIEQIESKYDEVVEDFTNNIIEIPRIIIQQTNEVKHGFKDFELDTKNLNYQPVSEEILVRKLREQENNTDIIIGKGRITPDRLDNLIVNELMNFSEVDYDSQSNLLFKLSNQAIEKFRTYLENDALINTVQYHKQKISEFIHTQMMQYFYFETPQFIEPKVYPFTELKEHNYSKYTSDSILDLRFTVQPTSAIPSKVFGGMKKACHRLYKFDSKTEKDFAIILENDSQVLKWLRPAKDQFNIYWKHNSKRYEPDFVVESSDFIYLIETKKETDIETIDVQEKAKAALQFCKHASNFTTQHHGKAWKYVLIPHNVVMQNMSFDFLVKTHEVKE